MGEAAKRIATYADIEALPPRLVGEIIDGELFTMSRPSPRHAMAQLRLGAWSDAHFRSGDGGLGGWWILPEPELHLGADVVVPDIGGWKKSRVHRFPGKPQITLAPDWVCEIISPSTASHDRVKKMNLYGRKGIPHAWLVNPLEHVLEVYQLLNEAWVRVAAHAEDEIVRVPPFQEVELNLATLWMEVED